MALAAYLADIRSNVEASYLQYISYYGTAMFPTLEDYILVCFDEEYFPNGKDSIDEGLEKMAKEQIKHTLLLHHIANVEGWNMTEAEADAAYAERAQAMLDYYNAYYGVAGTPNELTIKDLEDAGYTRDVILETLLEERVTDSLYEAMKDNVIFE